LEYEVGLLEDHHIDAFCHEPLLILYSIEVSAPPQASVSVHCSEPLEPPENEGLLKIPIGGVDMKSQPQFSTVVPEAVKVELPPPDGIVTEPDISGDEILPIIEAVPEVAKLVILKDDTEESA
jgi:hypothetical protein